MFASVMMILEYQIEICHKQYMYAQWLKKRKSNSILKLSYQFSISIGSKLFVLITCRLQDIITEISEKEKNFKILVYANGFKKIRITEKIIKELGIDTFAYERTNVGRRRRAMKEKVYYNFNATPNSVLVASDVVSSKVGM